MNKYEFLNNLGLREPMLCVHGDIFETPADHIAFAVHYPNKEGYSNNANGGFSHEVQKRFWPQLADIVFEKGVPRSYTAWGKMFHALPVHTNEEGGWDEAPQLIQACLRKLPVSSTEVIATVLMGGGSSGLKWKANPGNIEGMMLAPKTVVLYVNDDKLYEQLLALGIVANGLVPSQRLLYKTFQSRKDYGMMLIEENQN